MANPAVFRGIAAAGSLIAITLVLRRIDLGALTDVFSKIHPGPYLAAIALFGLGIIPSGLRWHTLLKVNHCASNRRTAVRMAFLSHFFATVLFGPSSGDIPKTILYCRTHGFKRADVLAASMLDRAVAGISGALFVIAALSMAWLTGGFNFVPALQWQVSPQALLGAMAGGAALVTGAGWMISRKPESFAARTLRSFGSTTIRLVRCGRSSAQAFGWSLLVVAALTSAQVLCVLAVSPSPPAVMHLFWGLHLATMIAAAPITIAGIGLREGVYVVVLGFYGVTAPTAVAAALLTLSLHAFWAAVSLCFWLRAQE